MSDSAGDIHSVPILPSAAALQLPDIMIMVGAIGGAVFFFLIATRIFPVINIWEQREFTLYRRHKKFHRTEVLVLGKPD